MVLRNSELPYQNMLYHIHMYTFLADYVADAIGPLCLQSESCLIVTAFLFSLALDFDIL